MKNQHANAIPAPVVEQLGSLLTQAIELIAPYAIALTPDERQSLPKMGEKTLSFVEKAHQFAQQSPTVRPPYLDMAEFDIDFSDAHGLWPLKNRVRQLGELLEDTTMIAGSEAYQAALVFYGAAKIAAAQDVQGAKAVYEDLRARFPGGRRKSADTTTA